MSATLDLFPDILDQEIEEVNRKLPIVAQLTDNVHIDIMDGLMVDNTTIDLGLLQALAIPKNLKIDMHLMVEYPDEYLLDCQKVNTYRVLAQIERMHSQTEFVQMCIDLGIKPGLAIDLYTPVEAIEKDLFEKLDAILVMTVKAGWSGQSFQESALDHVRALRQRGYQGHIVMDGGMNHETICLSKQAGADQFAINSYFWNAEDKQAVLNISCQSTS